MKNNHLSSHHVNDWTDKTLKDFKIILGHWKTRDLHHRIAQLSPLSLLIVLLYVFCSTQIYEYVHVCVCMCICVYMFLSVCVCIHGGMHMCAWACVCIVFLLLSNCSCFLLLQCDISCQKKNNYLTHDDPVYPYLLHNCYKK